MLRKNFLRQSIFSFHFFVGCCQTIRTICNRSIKANLMCALWKSQKQKNRDILEDSFFIDRFQIMIFETSDMEVLKSAQPSTTFEGSYEG
jgi:TRAP-type mannitol/chloroaromatic compound transport system permease small subunit